MDLVNGRTVSCEPRYRSSSYTCTTPALISSVEGISDKMKNGAKLNSNHPSLIENIKKRQEAGDRFFSLEFFPPRTKIGAVNLISRFERMREGKPLFCDITWHSAGDPAGDSERSSMAIADAALNYCALETVLHMTCCAQSKADVIRVLEKAQRIGIRNILALRGDIQEQHKKQLKVADDEMLSNAKELVAFIRQHFGNDFVIGVAGYPEGHPDAHTYADDINYLKEKVNAGADFIITQLFFKGSTFTKFVADCRFAGIDVPILPGVMPIQSYDSLRQIVKLSKLSVPSEIVEVVQSIKDNDEAIRNYGIDHAVQMIKEIFDDEKFAPPSVHLYTLNREVASVEILKQVGLWQDQEIPRRLFPWQSCSANRKRSQEDVRPIFWSSRPKSYNFRTKYWDEFPNGRWGSSDSPAFGELQDYHLFFVKSRGNSTDLLKQWGEGLEDERDVWNVFYWYISGEKNRNGIKVVSLPWNERELSPETTLMNDNLKYVISRGVLTINSQPNINGAPSTDPLVGWGYPGGYVYQKAYLEFFISGEYLDALLVVLPMFPHVNYHIINHSGEVNYTNSENDGPIAVTWGVFPGKEIIQPTVVDPVSFRVWKDEAFALWTEEWGKLYGEGSHSKAVIDVIRTSYVLVNLVDNNFVNPNCLWSLLDEMFAEQQQ